MAPDLCLVLRLLKDSEVSFYVYYKNKKLQIYILFIYLTGSPRNSKHGSRQGNKCIRYVSGVLLDSLFISYDYYIYKK